MYFGPEIIPVTLSTDSKVIAVAPTAVIYTKSINLKRGEFFAIWYKATSEGTVNIKIEIEQSYKLPTTEGAVDTDWVVPESMSAVIAALDDENAHCESINPIAMPYLRLKITGGVGNDATTTLAIEVGKISS